MPKVDNNYKYIQFGYLVGGSLKDGYYEDNSSSYSMTEGGIDYNAGLVGALAYINSKLNPISTTDVKETVANAQCAIYPNPTQNRINIQLSNVENGTIRIEVINEMGALCRSLTAQGTECAIDLEDMTPGIYVIRVVTASEVLTERIIKE